MRRALPVGAGARGAPAWARLAATTSLWTAVTAGCGGETAVETSAGGGDCGGSAACAGSIQWGARFGGVEDELMRGVAVDGSGNIVLTGTFEGELSLGGGALTSAGKQDAFVAKLDAEGHHLWSQRIGDDGDQDISSPAVDATGNIFFVARNGIISSDELHITKLDAKGNLLWKKVIPTPNGAAADLVVDAAGGVVLTGYFSGTLDLGGGPLQSVDFGTDVFIAKLDAEGNHVWSKRFGGEGAQLVTNLAVGATGDIVVTGSFEGTLDLGAGLLVGAEQQIWNIFVAKLDASGTTLWSRQFGDLDWNDYCPGIAVDSAGNIVMTGEFRGTIDFGGGPLTSAGETDVFLAKLDGAGGHVWSKRFGDALWNDGRGVAVDEAGNVFATGEFSDTLDLGGGVMPSPGSWNTYVAKFAPAGDFVWARRFGDPGDMVAGIGVAVAPDGDVVVGGTFTGAVNLGHGPVPNAGGFDLMVAKLMP